jgi:Cu-Zn family superoxide dismutase
MSEFRHIGDLSNIMSGANRNVHMNLHTNQISLFAESSVAGKAIVVHTKEDDLGRGSDG